MVCVFVYSQAFTCAKSCGCVCVCLCTNVYAHKPTHMSTKSFVRNMPRIQRHIPSSQMDVSLRKSCFWNVRMTEIFYQQVSLQGGHSMYPVAHEFSEGIHASFVGVHHASWQESNITVLKCMLVSGHRRQQQQPASSWTRTVRQHR
jgi:hypothetical protein